MNLNKAMIIGNLTRDPEMRNTPQGTAVASFSVATNMVWTDGAGQKQKKVEFHNVVAWKRLAEVCGQYLRKGSKVYIEGRLQTRDWQGQDGVKRYRTEIVAENMIMLDRKESGGESSPFAGSPSSAKASPFAEATGDKSEGESDDATGPASGPEEVIEEEIKVEDIPF